MARVNIIEWIAKKLRSLTGIVEDGDTATHAISAGKYVIWKGNPCKVSSAISIGDALSSSNLTELTDGVCNDLADETGAKVNKTDIVDNLTTNDSTKVLSAAQGYALNSKIVKQPDVLNATRTALSNGTFLEVTSTGAWYAVKAVNSSTTGSCSAYICIGQGNDYLAAVTAPSGTFQRALTPWIYFPSGKKFYVRAFFTDSDASGLMKASASW